MFDVYVPQCVYAKIRCSNSFTKVATSCFYATEGTTAHWNRFSVPWLSVLMCLLIPGVLGHLFLQAQHVMRYARQELLAGAASTDAGVQTELHVTESTVLASAPPVGQAPTVTQHVWPVSRA